MMDSRRVGRHRHQTGTRLLPAKCGTFDPPVLDSDPNLTLDTNRHLTIITSTLSSTLTINLPFTTRSVLITQTLILTPNPNF